MKKLGIALLVAATSACSMFSSVVEGAGDQAGRNIGASMVGSSGAPQGGVNASYGGGGSMSMATMNPAFLNMYMGVIFSYAFSSGGYDISQVDYKAGQYTRWTGHGQNGKGVTVERAHLFDDAQGRQWWKVKFTDDNGKTTILEGLLDPAQKKFVRMRAKFPDDKEGNEMAMSDQNYYQPAQKLTPESVQGATKGTESVSVPAGTFTASHVVFGAMDGTREWWTVKTVPGGAVKQLMKNPKSDQDRWEMELAAYGNDAKTELGTTP
ncbi:MAG TPA: hypothetical protein VLW85_08565 [Myxococcales bacterium]|nr:hypothetical protein [Myxococcales bacterium]